MYKVVLLDADGTLFDFNKAERYALSTALKTFSYKGDLDKISKCYKRININLWLELEKGNITKDKLKYERFQKLFEEYNLDYDVKTFSEEYLNRLGESNFLIDGAEDICRYLRNKQYKLIILTNGIKKVQDSRLEKSLIKEYIDNMVVSEEVGVNKPDPLMFEYTLKDMEKYDRNSIIMIGDSLTADIQGGINYKIDTCWLNLHNTKNDSNIQPSFEIHNLYELKDIL